MPYKKKKEKEQAQAELEEIILKDFDSELLNTKPFTEKELYLYYAMYSDIVVQYLRLAVRNELRPLTNEVRAVLGHLTEKNTDTHVDQRELEKAYGHIRRLTLDAFKILCDEYDDFFVKTMMKQYHYNFNSVDVRYLQNYSSLYIQANKAYTLAQQAEKTGSDSTGTENIIQLYHIAAKNYIELKQHYVKNKRKINRVRLKTQILIGATVGSFAFSTIVSILTLFFS